MPDARWNDRRDYGERDRDDERPRGYEEVPGRGINIGPSCRSGQVVPTPSAHDAAIVVVLSTHRF
jgi:hypothetical protein